MTQFIVGRALLGDLPAELPGVRKVLVIHPKALAASAELLRESLIASNGIQVLLAETPDGEASKRIEVADFCWKLLGENGFQRNDAVIGLGGGSTTDLAGFVAAAWLRGVRVVYIPTTLLAMVDASIGGKTGINTSVGKNLVGFFRRPHSVLVDFDALLTLPRNDLVSGMAELAKYGFISDETILDTLLANPEGALDPSGEVLPTLISRAIQIKEEIVNQDFEESGLRRILNYGHTLGHAIEHVERFQWRHGAAISIGMVFAAELSRTMGRLDSAGVDRHYEVFENLGLPVKYRADRWSRLFGAMQLDKKGEGGILRFVVLDALTKPVLVTAPEESVLYSTYQMIAD